jgi:hypothetical protein
VTWRCETRATRVLLVRSGFPRASERHPAKSRLTKSYIKDRSMRDTEPQGNSTGWDGPSVICSLSQEPLSSVERGTLIDVIQ